MGIPHGGIGFFDTGLGGLTVLFACRGVCGNFPIYYYGDNARAPYGSLPPETIKNYAAEAFDTFSALGARAAVIACNTVTAVCADAFREIYPFPIVGAEPAVFPAAKQGGEIFVLATPATVASLRFQRLCSRARLKYPEARIRVFGCGDLAGAVEKYFFSAIKRNGEPKEAEESGPSVATGEKFPLTATGESCRSDQKAEAFSPEDFDFASLLPRGNPDGVVLGCTHYIFLKKRIENFYRCPVFDGNAGIESRLSSVLSETDSSFGIPRPPETTFRGFFPPVTTFVPENRENGKIGLPGGKYPSFYELRSPSRNVFSGTGRPPTRSEEENNTNRCSCDFLKNRENRGEKSGFSSVFFLGSGKMVNKSVYEQMFAYKNGAGF